VRRGALVFEQFENVLVRLVVLPVQAIRFAEFFVQVSSTDTGVPIAKMEQVPKFKAFVCPDDGDVFMLLCLFKSQFIAVLRVVIPVNNALGVDKRLLLSFGRLFEFESLLDHADGVASPTLGDNFRVYLGNLESHQVIEAALGVLADNEVAAEASLVALLLPSLPALIPWWHSQRPPGSGRV
jgi:hypothetical protein